MKNRLVLIFRSTGENHICALNEDEAIAQGLELCNKHRSGVGLPPLNRFFEEARQSAQGQSPDSAQESDKERRAREYYERMKKWLDDEGLS